MANQFRVKKGLIVNGSGSTLLDVQGSQGQLFSVTDSLSGSLFAVKDISGIPVMEAFSDNRINLGTFNAEAVKVSGSFATVTGSLLGTSSYALTASWAQNFSGSISNAVSASYALTASYALNFSGSISNAVSSSYAATASVVPAAGIVGDLTRIATGSVTASVNVGTSSFQITSASSNIFNIGNGGFIDTGGIGYGGSTSVRIYASNGNSLTVNRALAGYSELATFYDASGTNVYLNINAQAQYKIGGDTVLARDSANVFAQRNGAVSQSYRIYNTYTDSSSFERGKLQWSNNTLFIGTEHSGSGNATSLALQTSGSTRIFVSSSGNVGINTTASLAIFHVEGVYGSLRYGSTANTNLLDFYNSAGNVQLRINGNDNLNKSGITFLNSRFDLSNASSTVISVLNNGYIGLNTTSPSYSLDVSGSGRFTSGLQVTGSLEAPNITGSLLGTASWARNSVTASYVLNAVSASFASTASYAVNITVSGAISNVDYIDFDTAVTFNNIAGRLGWDSGEYNLQLGMYGGNVQMAVGEQMYQYVYNAQGSTLTKGQVVYVSGSQGNRIAVKLASATAEFGSANTLGFVAETITSGNTGWVITDGTLRKVDTSGYEAGKLIYLSSSEGQYTQVSTQAPLHNVRLGYIERVDATVGSIYVKIDNGYELDEIHDVRIINNVPGDLLVTSGSLWINSKQLTGSYGLTGSLQATSFTGSLFGTASYANTASYLNTLNQDLIISGNLFVTSSITASIITSPTSSLILKPLVGSIETGSVQIQGGLEWKRTTSADPVEIGDLISFGGTMGIMDGGTLTTSSTDPLLLQIGETVGYVMTTGAYGSHNLIKLNTIGTVTESRQISFPPSSDLYVYYNSSLQLRSASVEPNSRFNILLGRVISDTGSIKYIDRTGLDSHHYSNYVDKLFRKALGSVWESGATTTEGTTPFTLNVTAGAYYFSEFAITTTAGTPITFDAYYRTGSAALIGGAAFTASYNEVTASNTLYDSASSGVLQSIPSGKYVKHAFYVLGRPTTKYLMVYGQELFLNQDAADAGNLPTPPGFVKDQFSLFASVVVGPHHTNISAIIDERPRIGFASPSRTGVVTLHANLLGLTADDHPQYLLVDGTRAMSGDLSLGGNDIYNVGYVSASEFRGPLANITTINATSVTASFNGNLTGTATTASYVLQAVSSSFASTASYVLQAVSSSFASTASFVATASWAQNAVTASYVTSTAIFGDLSRIATGSVTASVGVGSASFQITSGSSTFLFVSSSGNVGIGTTTASMTTQFRGLNITSPTNFGAELRLNTTDADRNSAVTFAAANSNKWQIYVDNQLGGGALKIADLAAPSTFPFTILDGGNIVITGSVDVSGSGRYTSGLQVTGSLEAPNITGSLLGTASWAQNSVTSSYVLQAVSSSFASTASYVLNAVSASYAATASSADNFLVRQNVTASNALFTGTVTAQTLVVQYITASTEFVTGSSKFGSLLSDTHQFTGSVTVTGSLTVTGPATLNNLTGSLFGTASWSQNAVTSSYILQAVSASFASTASFVQTAQTASYVLNAVTASYVQNAQTASFVATASWANNAVTASYITGSIFTSTNPALSASYALTASYALNAGAATAITVADEGTAQGTATFLNFTGAGVTATVSSNTASINIPGGAGAAFPYTGSAQITGSLGVTGSFSVTGSGYSVLGDTQFSGSVTSLYGYTGSLLGTASWAQNVTTASYVLNAVSASFASTASFVQTAQTASYVLQAVSASFAPDQLKVKSGVVAAGTFAGNPKKATVTFATAFANTSYAVTITGEDSRTWTIESKVAGSFVINANSNTNLAGNTYWMASLYGETL